MGGGSGSRHDLIDLQGLETLKLHLEAVSLPPFFSALCVRVWVVICFRSAAPHATSGFAPPD